MSCWWSWLHHLSSVTGSCLRWNNTSIRLAELLFAGLKHILTSFCCCWRRRAAITHKAPCQDSCLVRSRYDYPHRTPIFGLIYRVDWLRTPFPLQVCWPLTNQESSRGEIHYSARPLKTLRLQHNLSGLTFCLKHEDLRAWSQLRQSQIPVFWKHLGSEISLKEGQIIFNPRRQKSGFLYPSMGCWKFLMWGLCESISLFSQTCQEISVLKGLRGEFSNLFNPRRDWLLICSHVEIKKITLIIIPATTFGKVPIEKLGGMAAGSVTEAEMFSRNRCSKQSSPRKSFPRNTH